MPLTASLGVAWAFAVLALVVMQTFSGRQLWGRGLVLAGAAFGAAVGISATGFGFLLMLFKNVQHAHLTPDFPNETLLGILYRAPAWGVAGALLGMAAIFYWIATYKEPLDQ